MKVVSVGIRSDVLWGGCVSVDRGNVLRGVVRVCQWGLGLYGVGGCEGCVSGH